MCRDYELPRSRTRTLLSLYRIMTMPGKSEPLRIANCSGFYGDRLAAAREMLEGGPIDYLTGDYLAELTMLILFKSQQKEATKGYATTFLRQMEDVLGLAMERGVKIVTDAGGLNPAGLAGELKALADKLGIKTSIAHIEGDNLLPKLPALREAGEELRHLDTGRRLADLKAPPLTANAYLGAWGIVEALGHGANIVICPRSHRCLGGRRTRSLSFWLVADRLGPPGRSGRYRARAGMRRTGDRRQLCVLSRSAGPGAPRLSAGRDACRRIEHHY